MSPGLVVQREGGHERGEERMRKEARDGEKKREEGESLKVIH